MGLGIGHEVSLGAGLTAGCSFAPSSLGAIFCGMFARGAVVNIAVGWALGGENPA